MSCWASRCGLSGQRPPAFGLKDASSRSSLQNACSPRLHRRSSHVATLAAPSGTASCGCSAARNGASFATHDARHRRLRGLFLRFPLRRLNDDGSSQFDVSKVPFVDMDSVAAFLQGGMRADSLEALVMPTAPSCLGALAHALQECCSGIFSAIPLAVSATCACSLRHAVLSRGGADTSRLAAYGPSEYACFRACDESTGAGGELGILRHANSASANAGLEAVLLRFAAGDRIVDAQFYRDARLLVLLCDRTGAARLDMVACDQLEYAAVGDADTIAAGACSASVRALLFSDILRVALQTAAALAR